MRCLSLVVHAVPLRRLDMLPPLLSEQLCSLRESTPRLAVSVMWLLGPDLLPTAPPWFGRTVINNRRQLTYQQAQVEAHD
jgi:exoribonuclease R